MRPGSAGGRAFSGDNGVFGGFEVGAAGEGLLPALLATPSSARRH